MFISVANKVYTHTFGQLFFVPHSVTYHPTQVNSPRLTPARQAGTRFTYPGGMEGWVDLGDLLHTEMVYTPAVGNPSKY